MIYTSYFAKMQKMSDELKRKCVSVARFSPKNINIPGYIPVMPSNAVHPPTSQHDCLYH